jgi:hypothetical protein
MTLKKYYNIHDFQLKGIMNCDRNAQICAGLQAGMIGSGVTSLTMSSAGAGLGWTISAIVSFVFFCAFGWYKHSWRNMHAEIMSDVKSTEFMA